MVSVIVPVHNEKQQVVEEFLEQLYSTIEIKEFEVIMVDDGSTRPIDFTKIDKHKNLTIIKHGKNKGVGAAFDTGVKEAIYDNIILSACDIRFLPNGWAIHLLQGVERHPKSFICSSMVGLNVKQMDMAARVKTNLYHGATMLILHGKHNNSNKPKEFKSIIDAKWYSREKLPEDETIPQIPCILGALYGVKKDWYEYCDGFYGHRQWGTLEPLISLKSWLFGGDCRLHREAITGHIFKISGTHGTAMSSLAHNKLWTSYVLFDDADRERLWNWLPLDREDYKEALTRFDFEEAKRKYMEYLDKREIDIHEYFKRFDIDFNDDKTSEND